MSAVTAWNDSWVIPLVTEITSVVSTVVSDLVHVVGEDLGVKCDEVLSPVVCRVEMESSS